MGKPSETHRPFLLEMLDRLPQHRRDVYRSYRLGFLDDGMPGKVFSDELRAHPLFPTYLIHDFLREWTSSGGDRRFLQAAVMVADAALERASDFGEGLVFYYEPDSIGSLEHRYYSGLTQARYLRPLDDLSRSTGDEKYREVAKRVFASLMVPSDKGGVMLEKSFGPVIEEYPHEVPLYVLNGWTSAIIAILDHARRTDDAVARDFAMANIEAMLAILDRYDVPQLANTRYGLADFTWFRLVFSGPGQARVTGGGVTIPSEGHFPFRRGTRNRYLNWVDGRHVDESGLVTGEACHVNVVLSRMDEVNTVRVDLDVGEPTLLRAFLPTGRYDPLMAAMPVTGWRYFAEAEMNRGTQSLSFDIPLSSLPLIGYPTNFKKVIAGRHYNSYHYLHARNLYTLHQETGDRRLVAWIVRWVEYLARWHGLEWYQDERLCLAHVPNGSATAFPT